MRDVDTAMVLRLVAENAKQRFELFYGYDPSPPRPKVRKGQGKGKGRPKPVQTAATSVIEGSTSADPSTKPGPGTSSSDAGEKKVDAAQLDDLSEHMEKAKVSTELPLVEVPRPDDSTTPETATTQVGTEAKQLGEWFIRATQGHSIKLESDAHLTLVLDDEDGRKRAGVCVHGTRWELWETLSGFDLFFSFTPLRYTKAIASHV